MCTSVFVGCVCDENACLYALCAVCDMYEQCDMCVSFVIVMWYACVCACVMSVHVCVFLYAG